MTPRKKSAHFYGDIGKTYNYPQSCSEAIDVFVNWLAEVVSLVAGIQIGTPSMPVTAPAPSQAVSQAPSQAAVPAPSRVAGQATVSGAEGLVSLVKPHEQPVTVPQHLFLPPNPPEPPGKTLAAARNLHVLLAERTTNYYHAVPTQGKNIELLAKRLNGVVVQPGETFSYYQHVGPYTAANGYGWGRAFDGDRIVPSMGGGVCQGASTLYSALLRTNLPIVERHNHGLTVPYLPAGEDATVAASAHMDFRFKNNEGTPIMIGAQADAAKRFLTVAIWGAHQGPQIGVRHRLLAEYPYKTIHQNAHAGKAEKVLFPGQEGAVVETWIDMQTPTGVVHHLVSKDTYLASNRVITTN